MWLLLAASALSACNKTREGPLAYHGIPNSWVAPVAVGHPRAWGLIRFGKDGVQATIDRINFDIPAPEGLVTKVEVNSGQPVGIGALHRSKGETAHSLPTQISGVAQIVVWFAPQQTGIEYFTPQTNLLYSVDGQDYEAKYPVGVGICSVEKVTAKTLSDADASPSG